MIRINPFSIFSFVNGLIALFSAAIIFLFYNFNQTTDSLLFISDGCLIPVRNVSAVIAVLTGIMALMEIRKKGHAEKGIWLAWTGIILGTAWLLVGICVGLVFIISMIVQL